MGVRGWVCPPCAREEGIKAAGRPLSTAMQRLRQRAARNIFIRLLFVCYLLAIAHYLLTICLLTICLLFACYLPAICLLFACSCTACYLSAICLLLPALLYLLFVCWWTH